MLALLSLVLDGVSTSRAEAHSAKRKEIDMSVATEKMSEIQDQVLDFLQTHNLEAGEKGFRFSHILWALRDKPFFKRVIAALRDRFIFDSEVWSYGFYHCDDEEICREYLECQGHYKLNDALNAASLHTKLLTKRLD